MPRRATALSRVLVTLSTIVVVLVLLLPATGSAEVEAGPAPVTYTVKPGDTLWEIASDMTAEGDDVRVLVQEVRRLNDLSTSLIMPGQKLALPVLSLSVAGSGASLTPDRQPLHLVPSQSWCAALFVTQTTLESLIADLLTEVNRCADAGSAWLAATDSQHRKGPRRS